MTKKAYLVLWQGAAGGEEVKPGNRSGEDEMKASARDGQVEMSRFGGEEDDLDRGSCRSTASAAHQERRK